MNSGHQQRKFRRDGTTAYTYDSLGRTVQVARPDGSIVFTSYKGNESITTDEVGSARGIYSDSLGRVSRIDEPIPTEVPVPATATLTISGNGIATHTIPGTAGTGTVYLAGTEKQVYYCPAACTWTWDQGTVSVSVNGTLYSTSYGQSSTQQGLAQALAGIVNGSSLVSTSYTTGASSFTVTARTSGANTNYPLVGSSASNLHPTPSGAPVFTASASGLSNGTDASTIYDSGTVSATVNQCTASTTYSQSGNNSSSAVASALAAALNSSCGTEISASASGNGVTITALAEGPMGNNYTISATSASNSPSIFSSPSFTASSNGFAGGSGTSLSSPLTTLYTYDALDNLTCAVQKGTDTTAFTTYAAAPATWRPRSFVYDSLSRVTSAKNPESGTISYTYDLNGNMATRVTPTPGQTGTATTTHVYTYDVENRELTETHAYTTDGTVKFAYDGSTNLTACGQNPPTLSSPQNVIHRRSQSCAGYAGISYSFDPMGRVTTQSQTNFAPISPVVRKNYAFNYTYFFDGSLKTIAYPSGATVTYAVGGAGRPTQASDSSNNVFATSATYAPFGGVTGMSSGSKPIVTANIYNSRLQPIWLSAGVNGQTPVLSLCYDFHSGVAINNAPCQFSRYTSGNNGNIFQILNNVDPTRSTTFAYDLLNRIVQANTINTTAPCWGEKYTIDNWGNLTNIAGVPTMGSCVSETFNGGAGTNANQLTSFCYDAAGNLSLTTGACPSPLTSPTYSYDPENRLGSTAGYNYYYDADGVRVEKQSGSTGTMYWTGPGGEYLTETDLNGNINEDYIYFGGQRIARVDRPSGTVHYYFSNHLGSHTVVTSATGACEQDIDFYPYGGVVTDHCPGVAQHYKFTGKERDSESGLDNFIKRYHASSLGRFMTPDPIMIMKQKFRDPQQWNMYSYARNNPLRFTDSTGQYVCNGNKDQCAQIKSGYDAAQKALAAAKPNSKQAKQLKSVLGFLGKPGEANGVAVTFGKLDTGTPAQTTTETTTDLLGKNHTTTTIKFDLQQLNPDVRLTSRHPLEPLANDTGALLAHEGTHGRDDVAQGHDPESKAEALTTERNAYRNEGYVYDLLGVPSYVNPQLIAPGANRDQAIEKLANASVDSEGW